ncbi:MAG: proline dehydrogenase family protein [Candidatus Eremiobacteraeota bacterium]|nr:proline dehydrogenase family protein [Candidatus Eremiobacteraeota bacterium]
MALIDGLLAPESSFQKRFFFLAKRFVAGESIDAALAVVRSLNAQGMSATLDFLGEDAIKPQAALDTRRAYFEIMEAIGRAGLDSNVSLKLTALGLLIGEDFAGDNLAAILARAQQNSDPFVRIDMEGSKLVDATLRVFERLYRDYRNVGPVLQAYLKRTPVDVERAITLGARVRLCKGAYNEPSRIAYKDMPTIRRQYSRMAERLLSANHYPGIATHDPILIDAVKEHVRSTGIGTDAFEFQLLFGVRPEMQRALVAQGYRVRVYIPFGTHWATYFYRRITERKENIVFALRSIWQK